jgi:hypothetical protein
LATAGVFPIRKILHNRFLYPDDDDDDDDDDNDDDDVY